jgi:hypothetical protein
METHLLKSREILTSFLQRWPLDSVKTMTLSDYVNTGNPDTFCQWIETQTRPLGSIKGHFSNKFGIYKRKNPDKKPPTLVSDATYSWLPYYGKTRNEAFKNVKQDIISIILAAQSRDFSRIDKIHLNHLVKWKIAFLYSNEQLVPIFKKDILWNIAEEQGLLNAKKQPISRLQAYIFGNRPTNKSIYWYAVHLYREFGGEESEDVAYYLIGSKYGDNADQDMLPLMDEYSVVCTGFAWEFDLSHLYRADTNDIVAELKQKGELSKSYNTFRNFLQLKPGDIVAIKSSGSPKGGEPFLEIVAYAVVVERDGVVYWHDTENFGHCINVAFIKTGITRRFSLGGYGRTIHRVTDEPLIRTLFNPYINAGSSAVRNRIKARRRNRRASKTKNTSGQRSKGSGAYVTNPRHNKIQQFFKEYLVGKFGESNVRIEENNVDIKLLQPESITFYEVKPYDWAEDCIRAGLGQLLSYVFFDKDIREKRITIVGPFPPDKEEQNLIAFLKTNLTINFNYDYFEID